MWIATLRLTSPRFDSSWQVALNAVGLALWVALVLSLVAGRRRGRRVTGWDWLAIVVHASVDGIYLPIGPAIWFLVNASPARNLDWRDNENDLRWWVCLAGGVVLGLITVAEAAFAGTVDLVSGVFALYCGALAAIRHARAPSPHEERSNEPMTDGSGTAELQPGPPAPVEPARGT